MTAMDLAMTTRLRVCALALLAGCTAASPESGRTDAERSPPQPNVLIVLTDDQGARGTLSPRTMPATHRWFVRGGSLFENAFATTPLCCPSRASIMTGRYAHNHGVLQNGGADGPRALDQAATMQHALERAGYRTAIAGKFFNHWPVDEDPLGFDEWAIFDKGYEDVEANVDGERTIVREYSTGFVEKRALSFVRDAERSDEQPWFLYLAPFAPHGPATPSNRYAEASVPPWRPTPAFLEADLSDKPPFVPPASSNPGYVGATREDELRTLRSVDDLVGRLAALLRDLGEERETLAFFLSDNGHLLGEHGLQAKAAPYTDSVAIPFAVRWPAGGVAADARDPRLVAAVDVAPTVYAAAGVEPPGPLDGRSVLGGAVPRREILLEAWASRRSPTWASVRSAAFQYVEYYGEGEAVRFREYYDLRRDPWQLENLLAGASGRRPPAARVAALGRELGRARTCSGTEGPAACP